MTRLTPATSGGLILTPLDQRLLGWLDTDTSRFERYISAHPEAADRIDQLLALGDDIQQRMSRALDDAFAVPHNLVDRLSASIGASRDTGAASVAMDLFGIAGETFVAWLTPETS